MLYSGTLLFIHPVYASLHLLIPNSKSFSPPPHLPLGNLKSVPHGPILEESSNLTKVHDVSETPFWDLVISQFSSVQFSCSVVSDSLRSHESQYTRPPCPSQTPGVYANSCALSRWCHPAISSSVTPFSCPQSLPASGSFPMSQLF